MTAPNWRDDALCAQTDIEAFYPGTGEDYHPALAVCSRCPVTTQCLGYALAIEGDLRHGIWGGTTAKERSRIAAKRRREATEVKA